MNILKKTLLAASLFAIAGVANAMPITGTINIGGQSTVTNDGTNSTGITFGGGSVNTYPAPTGTFSTLSGISTSAGLTLNNFLYTDIPSKVIWNISSGVNSYAFTLTSVTVSSGDSPDFSNLVLNGTGYFNATGYDQTPGSWTYSQSGASFSSQSVPEPAVALLLGAGLIGFGVARKARKAA